MKQFKNLILAGALVVGLAGFAVSCNKYGDDIEEIRSELNKLATKDDVATQISSLQSALSAAQSATNDAKAAAEKALAEAKAAGDQAAAAKAAADKAAAEAKEAVLAEVEKKLGALQEQLESVTEDALAEVAKAVEDAKKELEEITGAIADSITSIELVYSNAKKIDDNIRFTTIVEKANVFGKDLKNEITFTKDAQKQRSATFKVRVSPANAELTPEMISLVNSKGQNLDEVIEVVSVKRFNGLLTKAAENSGLWTVEVALKNYEKKAFEAIEKTKDGKILYAVQANNTSYSEVRYATSSYDLTLSYKDYSAQNGFGFWVNEKFVDEINNRFDKTSVSFNPKPNEAQYYKEMKWAKDPAVAPVVTGNVNVATDTDDNRSLKPVYPAVQDEPLLISLYDKDEEAYENIRAFYVVLDEKNAVESAPSELNAWKSYTIEGLNEVCEGSELELTIKSNTSINDVIGFRVYAVNYDGTLVDPDGRAFYVQIGNAGQDWNAIATTVVPQSEKIGDFTTTAVAAKATKLTDKQFIAEWTTDVITKNGAKVNQVFNVEFQNASGKKVFATTEANTGKPLDMVEFNTIAKVKVTSVNSALAWTDIEDDKAYTGTLTIKSTSGHVLATIQVSMTKKLPEGLPTTFSPKTNQIIDGVWNAYLIPDEWTAPNATAGTMAMTEVFNFGTTEKAILENYQVIFETTKADEKGAYTKPYPVAGNETLEVAKALIDNKTQHATTVKYNYGQISSVKNAKGEYVEVIRNYSEDFQTVYNCIYNSTYTWNWATREQLEKVTGDNYTNSKGTGYKTDLPYQTTWIYGNNTSYVIDLANAVYGVSSRDSRYNAALGKPYEGSLTSVEQKNVKVISNQNKVEEYFEVVSVQGTTLTFKEKADSSNPVGNVPSTLVIKCQDSYGHDVTVELAITIKQR